MMVDVEQPIALGPFTVDFAAARLRRDGIEIDLRPQAFRVLRLLIQNPGQFVDFDRMIKEAWGGIQVSRHTVSVTVAEVKSALCECGDWIVCRSKLGYCLEIPESECLIRRGRHFQRQFSSSGLTNALRCFEQAAEKDGGDSRGFAALASIHLARAAFMTGPPRTIHRQFLEAHDRAVALGGWTPELRMDYAYGLFVFERKAREAESILLELRRELPAYAEPCVRLAMTKTAFGQLDEAVALNRQAYAADELLPPLAFVDIHLRLFRREFDLAAACGRRALELHPASQFGRVPYAEALEHLSCRDEALQQYHLAAALSPEIPWIRAAEARALAASGRRLEAFEALEQLKERRSTNYVDAYHMALLLYRLGMHAAAWKELDRAWDENSYMLLFLDVDPKADALRESAGFTRLRKKVAAS